MGSVLHHTNPIFLIDLRQLSIPPKSRFLNHERYSQEWEKVGVLLKTIDKTIQHLNGKKKMKDKEIFDGFFIALVKKAKDDESYAAAEQIVVKSVKNPTKDIEDVKKRGKDFYENINKTACDLFQKIASCIEKELDPASAEVQRLIKKHHVFIEQFHNATPEVYKAMAELYKEHPAMRKQLDPFHPTLAIFMAEAMKVFADRELS